MKRPQLATLPDATPNTSFSEQTREIKKVLKAEGNIKKQSYSIRPSDIAYIADKALKLGQERGKPATASEALRIILDEHRGQKMKGVAILSDKGGVGKSSLCHLLALGAAGWRGVPSYMFHTDKREPMKVSGRPYAYIDGRKLETLSTMMGSLINNDGFCIIDGGGNRPDFDKWIADAVDLVLIPVTADEEAVQLAKETMKRLEGQGITHARYILNMVSPNEKQRLYDFREFFSALETDKITGQIKNVAAVKRLRISDDKAPFSTPPANVNSLSRYLHEIVDDALAAMNEAKTKAVA